MTEDTIKMFIDDTEVVCSNKFSIKEEMLSASSAILNNCYPKSWETTRDYTSNFYFPEDYSRFILGSGNYTYGTNQYYTLTATGQYPSFTTNNERELQEVQVDGNYYQYTTTGKNLWANNYTYAGVYCNVVKSDLTYTATVTTVSGNARITFIIPKTQFEDGKTYTISKSGGNVNSITVGYASSIGNTTHFTYFGRFNSQTATFTYTDVPENYVCIYFYFPNDTVGDTFEISNIQIEQGSTATSYEPYTGGIASPNPDYPQDIEVIDGCNLFKNTEFITTRQGLTFTNNIKKINVSGQTPATYYPALTMYADGSYITENWWPTTNTINTSKGFFNSNSIDNKVHIFTDSELTGIVRVAVGRETVLTGQSITLNNQKLDYSMVIANNTEKINFISIGFIPNMTVNTNVYIQINKGIIALNYLPYGYVGIKLTGKNFWGFKESYTSTVASQWVLLDTAFYLKAGTYTFSVKGETNTWCTFNCKTENKARTISVVPNPNKTITFDEDIYYMALNITTNGNTIYDIQIEKGSTATSYEAYKSQLTAIDLQDNFIGKVGTVQDELTIDSSGNVILTKNVGKVVLNGTESWKKSSTTTIDRFYLNITDMVVSSLSKVMSNYFKNNSTTTPIINTIFGGTNNNIGTIFVDYTSYGTTTLDNFKTWLTTHNTEVYYQLATPYTVNLGQASEVLHSYNGQNNISLEANLETENMSVDYLWKNYDVIFSGVVKNTGNISLNPRQPHYCNLQVLDYKTFLSESDSLDFVISNKTIKQAIQQVISSISGYGFIEGNINISRENDIIGAYSTLNQSPYDVLQYLANISGSVWRTRIVDDSTQAIDFYDTDLLPTALSILYTTEFFENNNIVDISFSYGTRDYRNKQIILSDEVYADITYTENIYADGYSDTFTLQENVGTISSITINGVEQEVITKEEKETGLDYDFYYTPGKQTLVSDIIQPVNTEIVVNYIPLIKGRQIVYNQDEVNRLVVNTDTKGVIARYETRNDTLSSSELNQIAQTYIKYKGNAEIILKVKTKDNDLYNLGEVVVFDAPINDLFLEYMVKSKTIEYIVLSGIPTFFYTYELTSSFNSEKAINYFDNQRNKASGNISLGESIVRNIDVNNTAYIIFNNLEITEISGTGDNILNSVLNSPFNN